MIDCRVPVAGLATRIRRNGHSRTSTLKWSISWQGESDISNGKRTKSRERKWMIATPRVYDFSWTPGIIPGRRTYAIHPVPSRTPCDPVGPPTWFPSAWVPEIGAGQRSPVVVPSLCTSEPAVF